MRASGERPGGNYRFRYKTADNDSAFFGNAYSSSDFCIVAPPFYDKAQKAAGRPGYQAGRLWDESKQAVKPGTPFLQIAP